MKKTTIKKHGNAYNLYTGIDELYGKFLFETDGNPVCLNDLEDSGADDIIEYINNVIVSPYTEWEACTEEDIAYVYGILSAWGIVD